MEPTIGTPPVSFKKSFTSISLRSKICFINLLSNVVGIFSLLSLNLIILTSALYPKKFLKRIAVTADTILYPNK